MYNYSNSNWQDLLTGFVSNVTHVTGGSNDNITSDEIGNPININGTILTWKNGRELASYNDGINNITYKYNLDGIRTSKIVNGLETKYYLEGRKVKFEKRNDTVLYYLYNGDEILGFVYDGNTYYYHKNIFGDIIGILDYNYNEIVTYSYDAFGNITSTVDNSGIGLGTLNPFRYRSYYYDEETGLYYLNSRYYNPQWGRFINADAYVSTGQGFNGNNMFVYCGNNYINYNDGNGNFSISNTLKKVKEALGKVLSKIYQKDKDINIVNNTKTIYEAEPLNRNTADYRKYNCYGNAIGKVTLKSPTGYKTGDSSEKVFSYVVNDIGVENIRRLNGINDIVYDDENLVALKAGKSDYHFMVRVDGVWYNKFSTEEIYNSIVHPNIYVQVIDAVWDYTLRFDNGKISKKIYDDETIYLAIKKNW